MRNPPIQVAFTHQPPKGNQTQRYALIREEAKRFARLIQDSVPPSEDREQALAKLRETVMWANAGIACNETSANQGTVPIDPEAYDL